MTLAELERRLVALEKTVESLHDSASQSSPSNRWWVDHAGRFENDPLFDAAVRLGREYRESLRPTKKSRSGRKK